jgi:hypothetical protein
MLEKIPKHVATFSKNVSQHFCENVFFLTGTVGEAHTPIFALYIKDMYILQVLMPKIKRLLQEITQPIIF